jgi:hypothetical protein
MGILRSGRPITTPITKFLVKFSEICLGSSIFKKTYLNYIGSQQNKI